jgi:hypothetical protein
MEFGPFIVCRFTPVGDLRLLNLNDGCKGAGSSEKTRTTQQLVWTLGLWATGIHEEGASQEKKKLAIEQRRAG